MAFSALPGLADAAPVPGFNDARSEAAERALSYATQKNADNMFALASGVPAARAQYAGMKEQADAMREQAAASRSNALIGGLTGILGTAASGFTGGLGTAAGKKWFG